MITLRRAVARARTRRTALAAAGLAAALVAGLAPATASADSGGTGETAERTAQATRLSSSFRVASFNVLGASHTERSSKGFDTYQPRMRRTIRLIENLDFSIVGLQEYQVPQHEMFLRRTDGRWAVYPGLKEGRRPVQNSITWRRSEWKPVEKHLYKIPYFRGKLVQQPYVKLRHRAGFEVWVVNTHNPADSKGPAQRYRDEAVVRQARLANRLAETGVPVIVVGDFNDRDEAFCDLTARAKDLTAANGGGWYGGVCTPPRPMRIDWIFHSTAARASGYTDLHTPYTQSITDHAVIYADMAVPMG